MIFILQTSLYESVTRILFKKKKKPDDDMVGLSRTRADFIQEKNIK